jgi:hypothetical protein
MNLRSILSAAGVLGAAFGAQALTITSLTPQGEVAQVRQVVAKFDASAVNFGDPKAPAPFSLSCSDAQATAGNGRWISDREWAFQFAQDLPPGVRCTLQPRADFKSPKGEPLSAAATYTFNTGGPFVQHIRPGTYQRIEEEQHFLLQLNGPATPQSVMANVWCALDGLGERVPVRLIDGAARTALLASQGLEKAAAKDPLRYVALACARRFTPASKVQIVFGKGVATPGGVPNSVEKRFTFTVREPFSVSFNCERENAQAACLPIRPMRLAFNAPVARKLAEAIRLKSASESFKPTFDRDDAEGDALVSGVSFKGVLPEKSAFTVELPTGFQDASGRAASNAASFPLKVATGVMPPLAKFAAAPFGIVERFAEPDAKGDTPALLPVTLRNVEPALKISGLTPAGKVSDLQPKTDADIIAWFRKVQRYNDFTVPRSQAAADVKGPLPRALDANERDQVQSRMVSLLAGQPGVKTLDLPKPASKGDPRPFEVVGIPLAPGFHVVEIASPMLGAALLDERHGTPRTMVVRTSALVTNLGVHFKLGRENALAWVTTLDKGQPVAGAAVRCRTAMASRTGPRHHQRPGRGRAQGPVAEPPACIGGDDQPPAYFVSARANIPAPGSAAAWTTWPSPGATGSAASSPGASTCPPASDPAPDQRAHTVMDRTCCARARRCR